MTDCETSQSSLSQVQTQKIRSHAKASKNELFVYATRMCGGGILISTHTRSLAGLYHIMAAAIIYASDRRRDSDLAGFAELHDLHRLSDRFATKTSVDLN